MSKYVYENAPRPNTFKELFRDTHVFKKHFFKETSETNIYRVSINECASFNDIL